MGAFSMRSAMTSLIARPVQVERRNVPMDTKVPLLTHKQMIQMMKNMIMKIMRMMEHLGFAKWIGVCPTPHKTFLDAATALTEDTCSQGIAVPIRVSGRRLY